MKSRHLILPVAAGIAFAAAFLARRFTTPPEPVTVVAAAPALRPEEAAARFSKSWSAALAEFDPLSRTEAMLVSLATAGRASLPELAVRHVDDPATLQLILHRWAELDPHSAARWVRQALREDRVRHDAMEQVAEVWAARDPSGLAIWLKEPSNAALQYLLMPKLTGALFARDPAAAFALAKDFPEYWCLPPEAISWVRENPAAAAQALAALPLNNRSLPLAAKAAAAWTERDAPAAAAWYATLAKQRGPMAINLLQSALKTWANKDPAATAAFSATQPHGNGLAFDAVTQWAVKDPAAALAWVVANAHPSERQYLVHGAISTAATKDLAAASALVDQMPDGGLRDKATAALSEVWSKTDPTAALTWFTAQPPGPGRDEAVARAASSWAQKDAAAAAAWAKSAPEGSLPLQTYGNIMDSMRGEPAAAYAWLNELPPSVAQSAATRLLGSTQRDVAAAFALPEGTYKPLVLDYVLNRFIRHSADIAVAQAAALAPDQRAIMRRAVEAAATVAEGTKGALTEGRKAELLLQLR